MDLDILKIMVEEIATLFEKKYNVEKVVVSNIEKAGGKDHYFVNFHYHMKDGFQPLNRFERQDITGDIVVQFKESTGIELTTMSTSSFSKEGLKMGESKSGVKYIITENKFEDVLKYYLEGVYGDFYYSWTDFNCGMGVCCDPYSVGFYHQYSDYDIPFFKLVMSKHYDDDGDYPEELHDELPEECEELPKIIDPKFDTYIIEEEMAEEFYSVFGEYHIWEKSLMDTLNSIYGTQAKDLLIRGDNI